MGSLRIPEECNVTTNLSFASVTLLQAVHFMCCALGKQTPIEFVRHHIVLQNGLASSIPDQLGLQWPHTLLGLGPGMLLTKSGPC